ncbi:MAG: tetratricopeptide repeat protein [Deltaproteobacteria bacterium]|nr:tetratricopeptide repeat protein [Deltaproteobacteria bacterium]
MIRALSLALLLGAGLAQGAEDPLADARAALEGGHPAEAEALLAPVLGEDGAAWGLYSRSLDEQGYPYAALIAAAEALRRDPAVAPEHLHRALELSGRVQDMGALGAVLAANMGMEASAEDRAEMAWLASRHAFEGQELGAAGALLVMVGPDSPHYPEAQMLRGVVLAQQGRYTDALAPLLVAYGLTREADRELHDLVNLNLGRTYFGAGNYDRAAEHYLQVRRSSPSWVEAQFEASWAFFRGEDMNGTLGLLMSHGSPFLEEVFLPEADLLRGYALFLLCKFPEASREIQTFEVRYKPLKTQLDALVPALTPAAGWELGLSAAAGKPTDAPPGLTRRYQRDARLQRAAHAVAQGERERARLASQPEASPILPLLDARMAALRDGEGARVAGNLALARSDLQRMFQDVQATRLDILRLEAELYQRAADGGALEQAARQGTGRRVSRHRDKLVWPYQGEYWADEVGYYRVNTRPECPQALTR